MNDVQDLLSLLLGSLQGWAKKWVPGLVNFVPAVAYHFCLNLSEKILAIWEWFCSPALVRTRN